MLYTFKKNGKNNDNNFNFDYNLDLNKYQDSNDLTSFSISDKRKDFTSTILDKMRSIFPWAKDSTDKSIEIKFDTPTYKIIGVSPEALNLEWNKAATRIYDYLYYTANPSYDFKICDVPVKVHGNYIQVGTTLIPKYTKSSFFDTLEKKERENIYNISLTINMFIDNNEVSLRA